MKINIANPSKFTNLTIKADMHAVHRIAGLKIYDTFDGKLIDDQLYEGHIFQITGGNDKEGFPMNKNVGGDKRRKVMLKPGEVGYKKNKNKGVSKRKSVCGNIVNTNISMLNVILVESKEGSKEIDGLTNKENSFTHFPKRMTKWAKKLNVDKKDLSPKVIATFMKGYCEQVGRKYKRITFTRYETEKQKKLKESRKVRNEKRKIKSQQEKEEFLKKNPSYGQIKL